MFLVENLGRDSQKPLENARWLLGLHYYHRDVREGVKEQGLMPAIKSIEGHPVKSIHDVVAYLCGGSSGADS